MRRADVLIVGGGPAGLSAARSYRASGGDGSVILVTSESHPPYRRPPLTKHFLRERFETSDLYIEGPEWFDDRRITLLTDTAVTSLDTGSKTALTDSGEAIGYADVVLATGSVPARPPFQGAGDESLLVMRRIEDSDALRERAGHGSSVVVVGSGFIGCEAAASPAMRGARVSLTSLESVPQEGRLGEKAGERVAGWLKEVGVELALGRPVASIASSCVGHMVTLEDGTSLEAETVLLGTGVKPHSALAVDAGIPVAENRIMVDASMRSSVPGVWAAGDVAHAFNPAAGRRLMVEHWGEALNQGAVAGRRLAGEEARWDDVPGFWSTIVDNTLKYRAWGDGFDDLRVEEDGPGFTVWYGRDGILVGALTHGKDDDYERSSALIAAGERF